VTRQRFRHEGRVTTLIATGKLFDTLGVPPLDPTVDRAMICGSPAMLAELSQLLDSRGFNQSAHVGDPGDYVVERAFVAR
jgi:ferredoxin--NADP+ reductase